MKINRCYFVLLSLMISLSAEAVDFSKSWFKPELIVSNAPICEDLLLQTKQMWSGSIFQIYPSSNMQTQQTDKVQINGKTVHLYYYTHSGCGGACERYQLLASNEPFPDRRENYEYYRSLLDESPSAGNFHFLSSDSGSYYLFLSGKDLNQLYKLTENASWRHECSVSKVPSPEQILKVKRDYSEVQASLSVLRGLVGGLRRGAGSSCGSMKTHRRWSSKIDDEFAKLLYAPKQKPKTEKRYDDSTYEIDLKNLELWSLQGLSEFDALNQYKNKLVTATNHLSNFYQKHFQWNEEESEEAADYAIKNAISSGIRFYSYRPFKTSEEADLRRAILQKRPLAEIRKIDLSGINKSFEEKGWFKVNESILNVAVRHPKAMSYLLESGFGPNSQNIFDKTPLMYAAQYDGFDSARLLIEAGAEVNTGTIIPNDNCGYTLRTSNMSPLHYAVRYSNKELIQLLIDNGASKFFDVRNGHNRPSTIEYPIDWLTRFDNEKLTDDDKAEIHQSLKLPGKSELAKLTAELNLQGEKLYAEGKFKAANDKFKEAIQVDSDNIRAINNFALTSLKLKDKQRSIQASTRVIESKEASKKQKASAYFNIGLACEGAGRYGLKFDGRWYCRQNSLEYFVKSYQTYPTTSRSNAIVGRFNKRDKAEFSCKSNSTDFEAVYKRGKEFHFLHKKPMEQVISDVERLFSTNESFDIERKKFTLTLKELTELEDGYFISTYKSNISIGEAFAFEEKVCSSLSSKLLPERDKLVYIQASNNKTEIDIEFDLDESYTIILSGNVMWKVSQVGTNKSHFIVNNGAVSDSSKIDFTALTKIHREWYPKAYDNRYISSNIRSLIGKSIYTKFKIVSNSVVTISDEDINRPKLIVNSFPTLDFYGYGDYKVAFTEPNTSFNNFMNLENIQLISSDPAQSGRDDQLYVPNINKYVDESEGLYFKVEKWRTGIGTYFGDGYFKK
ncbi:ankyrin repeat domain-containing protein [Shewanella benthica]|uniref:ankyrin repeat domain-containing protein n=1 Tax=Shewanella benthica TaxID=43661 RepID=UPI00187A0B4B|nr:ankyrin repeat domain-containing protein [Shewanella benthica]MBE7215290.1 ankyrin repeat domain-containing protein [Shewanella benthica]MCL1065043.1 ankyrin repeat domain-containing protein [Shewanella benthica]